MTTYKRQFTLRMQEEIYEKIKYIASKERRSIAMQIEYAIEYFIASYEKERGIKIRIEDD
ncbi:MAG: Arc family DNA-binding protein [Firmicutes bacterium]|nr:Arc family DNA-binding protein [Bacillota bacterium]